MIGRKPTLIIRISQFIEWYFDGDTSDSLAQDAIKVLREGETFKISCKDIFSRLGYIPLDIIKNKEVINPDHIVDEQEIQDPAYDYKARFE